MKNKDLWVNGQIPENYEKLICIEHIMGLKIQELANRWNLGVGTVHKLLKQNGIGKAKKKLDKTK